MNDQDEGASPTGSVPQGKRGWRGQERRVATPSQSYVSRDGNAKAAVELFVRDVDGLSCDLLAMALNSPHIVQNPSRQCN